MTIRIPQNHLSSRAEATGSFQIRPRVGRNEIPSPAWLYQHYPLTTFSTLLLLLFLLPSSLYSVFLSSSHSSYFVLSSCNCFSRLFLPTISVSTTVHLFLSLQSFLYTSTFLCPFLHTNHSLSFMLFAFSWSVFLVAMMSPNSEA